MYVRFICYSFFFIPYNSSSPPVICPLLCCTPSRWKQMLSPAYTWTTPRLRVRVRVAGAVACLSDLYCQGSCHFTAKHINKLLSPSQQHGDTLTRVTPTCFANSFEQHKLNQRMITFYSDSLNLQHNVSLRAVKQPSCDKLLSSDLNWTSSKNQTILAYVVLTIVSFGLFGLFNSYLIVDILVCLSLSGLRSCLATRRYTDCHLAN